MRTKYLADENGHWIPESEFRPKAQAGVMVMGDIEPYQSMITGEIISSRSTHRQHLRDHNCYEIGNEHEKMYKAYDNIPDVAPQQRKEIIRAQVDAVSHDEWKRMVKRDLDRIRWESRKD